ncbi:MAG TPA: prenyltransferase [Methanobacterium subterraneum]|uniref:Prenyltransferase n=1 Tax=Methanobacterium subterraneum TaxID=59277 RepID=A0A7J4TK23_9EURY|nr:prenyltransferase [Methanobacterium subterraneum]
MWLNKIGLILKLGRLPFLLFGFLCFTTGALLAVTLNMPFLWDRFLWGYSVLLLTHLSISYTNDYWDFEVDHYNQPTLFAGGSGVLVQNPDLRPFAKKFGILLIIFSLFLAVIFSFIYSSLTFLLIALFGNFLAWYYSAPPLKLSYRGFGEIATALSGFILPAAGYVAICGYLDLKIVMFTIPFIIFMTSFILSVEIPDMEGDKQGHKNTFIVKNGRKKGFIIIGLVGLLGTLSLMLLSLSSIFQGINFQLLVLMSLFPTLVGLYLLISRTSKRERATKLVNWNILVLVVFITVFDLYFLVGVMRNYF